MSAAEPHSDSAARAEHRRAVAGPVDILQDGIKRWWQQPDHFEWFSVYLSSRGIRPLWRAGIAGVVAVLALLPVIALTRPVLPHNSLAVIVSPIAGAVGLALALLWLIRWPTRIQSIAFCLASCVCTAAACLVQSDARVGLLGATAFAMLGGYVAFFHTAPYMLLNFTVAATTTAVLAVRLAVSYDIMLAGCAFAIIVVLNLAFPFAVQSLVHALGIDLRLSHRDALTGLLTRRAFYQAASALLLQERRGPTYLGVVMVDLDNFKRLNDTRGHSAGDQALVHVGSVLRLNCRPASAIGRFGGEEFIVADTFRTAEVAALAERLREAIAAIPFPVTASVGTASAALGHSFDPAERDLINRLVRTADTAMYTAKRAGGNRVASADIAEPASE